MSFFDKVTLLPHVIPEGVGSNASQVFLRVAHNLPTLCMRNTADVADCNLISLWLYGLQ
jgi:hypothetical protein